jgi:hypothetical protein
MAAEVKFMMERAEAEGLETGQSYAARVRAVNAAGAGPWSLDSEKLVARHKALRPKITFVGVTGKEIVVKEGANLKLVAEIEGEPPPEDVTFELNDNSVHDDANTGVSVSHAEYKSELKVRMDSIN